MHKARAFAPGNISCIFKIYGHKDPRWMGSYGLGFTIREGVIVEVVKSDSNKIFFNDKAINLPTVRKVIQLLTKQKIKLNINTSLPLGCGFGISGASALASAYALNKLLDLKKSNKELAVIAHTADVISKTGLGDVASQYFGGMIVKFKPSSHFIVEKLSFDKTPVYCVYFSKISTKSIINNKEVVDEINKSATSAMNKLRILIRAEKKLLFEDLIRLSKGFARNSGLLTDKKVIETIKNIEKNNGYASMIMLGNAVFSNKPFKGARRLSVSDKGAHIL